MPIRSLPLLALALLLITGQLDPADPLLKQRRRLFSQHAVGSAQLQRIAGAEKRLAKLRQLTARASSNAELNAGLQKLSGPVLGPADLAQPLPLLKAQVNAVFDQAQIQINRDRAALPPATATAALPELLRNSLACLLLAIAYAAFARRPGSDLSLLQEGRHRPRLPNHRTAWPGRPEAGKGPEDSAARTGVA